MSQATQIKLAPTLDFRAAGPLRDQFLAQRGKAIEVDGADVQRIGGQCIQVMAAAQRTWLHDGVDFALANPSDEMLRALGHVGMDSYFTELAAS
jgi:chemotaxis protein CheX